MGESEDDNSSNDISGYTSNFFESRIGKIVDENTGAVLGSTIYVLGAAMCYRVTGVDIDINFLKEQMIPAMFAAQAGKNLINKPSEIIEAVANWEKKPEK